ncbi:BLUF domain-containing protein [Halochromatium sp.]
MTDLIALLYISPASDSLSEEDLFNILQVSRVNNQRNDVTGVLCSGGWPLHSGLGRASKRGPEKLPMHPR